MFSGGERPTPAVGSRRHIRHAQLQPATPSARSAVAAKHSGEFARRRPIRRFARHPWCDRHVPDGGHDRRSQHQGDDRDFQRDGGNSIAPANDRPYRARFVVQASGTAAHDQAHQSGVVVDSLQLAAGELAAVIGASLPPGQRINHWPRERVAGPRMRVDRPASRSATATNPATQPAAAVTANRTPAIPATSTAGQARPDAPAT